MQRNFNEIVSTRYHMYNSLFLNLPYTGIYRTGTLLPLLQQSCELGYAQDKDPSTIISRFFEDYLPKSGEEDKSGLLFSFIQYAERQVVLFDAIEDSSFEEINDLNGRGTIKELIMRAKTDGVQDELLQKLEDFRVRVVLTAHPTQFYPGSVLAITNDLESAIREGRVEHINLLLRQLGRTPFINKSKPTPFDEAVSLCWYLENVFYTVIPGIILRLIEGLQLAIDRWENFDLIKIGFWPGGDRDGNPFVTHEITLQVAELLNRTLFRCYHRDLRALRRRLTFTEIDGVIARVEKKVYPLAYGPGGESYSNPDELLNDLFEARDILVNKHNSLFLELLDEFIIKVRIFGFHFASMDIRQDSRKHGYAWEEILRQLSQKNKKLVNFNTLSSEDQLETILSLKFKPAKLKFEDPFVNELLASIEVIGKIQQLNGSEGCHRYVISNCQSALDVIKVFHLARLILSADEQLNLDIVPLFETIEDLANAHSVMQELYAVEEYRSHLQRRGKKQTIMLGFSDGTKDGGYLRANWSIYTAKENLTRVTREAGFTALFFDGRGGPPARGGGNTHDFYASLGKSIEDKEVQITIQGQTISSNFGKPVSCRYNLEQLLSAGLENAVFRTRNQFQESEYKLMEQLAEEGHKAYLELKQHPRFVSYLEKVTPLQFFGDTNIGSRPVKRNSGSLRFEDLRAIPFVGSWAQMKQNIPGFYGVGTALKELKQQDKLRDLQDLFRTSLFFRTLLSNSMMSLTKSFYPATAYLSRDKEYGELWKKMYAEYKLSVQMILEVSGFSELMQNNPVNRDSVKLRERIVLPLITIQQFALQALRDPRNAGIQDTKVLAKLVMRCMFGIINAARNSA